MSLSFESITNPGKVIKPEFRRITNRKYEEAIGLLEDAREEKDRKKKLELRDQAFNLLVATPEVLEECTRGEVELTLAEAIKFNQAPIDGKKSD